MNRFKTLPERLTFISYRQEVMRDLRTKNVFKIKIFPKTSTCVKREKKETIDKDYKETFVTIFEERFCANLFKTKNIILINFFVCF